ncbi:MAG: TerB family tellurite resistance protein, partial [Rhodomicrobium sp.]
MSIWGKLTGAAASIGGPIGALLSRLSHENDKQVAFTVGVIALGAKMAKADGIVTRDEIEAFREVFKVPPGEEHNVA